MEKIVRPTLQELQDIIDKVNLLDLSSVEIDDIKMLILPLFKGYSLSTPTIAPGQIIYRAIVYPTLPSKIEDIWYPPEKHAKVNRASREGHSCFYCSTSRVTSFIEQNLKVGDKLVVSKWINTRNLEVNNIGYTESTFKILKSSRQSPIWNPKDKDLIEISCKENVLVREFLCNTFSQPIPTNRNDLYKLTIAIAEKHFSESIDGFQFDGILYPSIRGKGNSDNLAITKAFVDSGGLHCQEIEYYIVNSIDNSQYNVTMIDWANFISDDGNIPWKGRGPDYYFFEDEKYTEAVEDGRTIYRDVDGNIIDPE